MKQTEIATPPPTTTADCICHQGSVCTLPACGLYHHEGCSAHANYHATTEAEQDSGNEEKNTAVPSGQPTKDSLLKAVQTMDWGQVVMNGGPPCFAINTPNDIPDRFCGRAERWEGHGVIHKYVSLATLISTQRENDRQTTTVESPSPASLPESSSSE